MVGHRHSYGLANCSEIAAVHFRLSVTPTAVGILTDPGAMPGRRPARTLCIGQMRRSAPCVHMTPPGWSETDSRSGAHAALLPGRISITTGDLLYRRQWRFTSDALIVALLVLIPLAGNQERSYC